MVDAMPSAAGRGSVGRSLAPDPVFTDETPEEIHVLPAASPVMMVLMLLPKAVGLLLCGPSIEASPRKYKVDLPSLSIHM